MNRLSFLNRADFITLSKLLRERILLLCMTDISRKNKKFLYLTGLRINLVNFKASVLPVFLTYLSSEYMSSRSFWMGVPVTAQRAWALS